MEQATLSGSMEVGSSLLALALSRQESSQLESYDLDFVNVFMWSCAFVRAVNVCLRTFQDGSSVVLRTSFLKPLPSRSSLVCLFPITSFSNSVYTSWLGERKVRSG